MTGITIIIIIIILFITNFIIIIFIYFFTIIIVLLLLLHVTSFPVKYNFITYLSLFNSPALYAYRHHTFPTTLPYSNNLVLLVQVSDVYQI